MELFAIRYFLQISKIVEMLFLILKNIVNKILKNVTILYWGL